MAISLTHTTVAVGTDAGNGEIAKAEWNENHTITMAADRLLGRTTAGTGAVEEITVGTGLTLSAGSLAVTGSTYQPLDSELTALAGLVSAADRLPYFTGSGAASLATFTTAGRNLLDDASASDQRTTLGVGTGDSPQFTAINLGHASDTTLTRVSAGVMAIEGVNVVTTSATQTLSGKTITDLILEGAVDEEEFTITDAAAFVIDPSNGSLQKITLVTTSRTPAAAPAGWTAGKGLLLKINDGTNCTINWGTLGVTWVGGTAPTLATTGWTVVALWRDADAIYGKHVGDVA